MERMDIGKRSYSELLTKTFFLCTVCGKGKLNRLNNDEWLSEKEMLVVKSKLHMCESVHVTLV